MATKTETLTVVAAGFAAVAAFAGLGYYMGRDTASSEVSQLTREIELLKSAQGVENALDYLDDLSTYNNRLFRFSEYEEQLSEKEIEIREQSSQILELEQAIAENLLQIEIAEENRELDLARIEQLQREISIKYELRDSVSLQKGQSERFLDGAVLIGLQNSYSNRAVITVANETEFLDIGEVTEMQIDNARCLIALRTTSIETGATLDLTCRSEMN